jgi:hypothetical protein
MYDENRIPIKKRKDTSTAKSRLTPSTKMCILTGFIHNLRVASAGSSTCGISTNNPPKDRPEHTSAVLLLAKKAAITDPATGIPTSTMMLINQPPPKMTCTAFSTRDGNNPSITHRKASTYTGPLMDFDTRKSDLLFLCFLAKSTCITLK